MSGMSLSTPVGASARRERTRQRLREAAVRVIAERGMGGASVEEICERAGFTRGAFYSNFASKEDLCLDLLRQHLLEHTVRAQQALASAADDDRGPEALIAGAIDVFVDSQDTDVDSLVTMSELRLHALRSPELHAGYTELQQRTQATFTAIITEATERHGLRLQLTAEETTLLLGAVFEHGLLEAALHAEPDVRPRLKRQMVTVLQALLVDDTRGER